MVQILNAKYHQFGDGVPQRVLIPFDFVGPVGVITHMYPKSLKLTVGALAMERIIYGYKRLGRFTFVKKSGLRGSVPIGWLLSFDEASYIDGGKLTRDR